jgi:hypothetical protein
MSAQRRFGVMVLGLTLAAWLATGTARAAFVVVPGGQTSSEGNFNNGFPFNIALFGLSTQRYQQVYNASDFTAAFGGKPELITQIAFRPAADGSGGAFSSTLPNIQIDLSTTSVAADGLSTTYANNVGADDTVVHSGSLSLSSSFTDAGNGTKAFDIVITLTTPFLYDPSKGNLLLDVRNFGGGSTTQFDAEILTGDAVSRVFNTNVAGSDGTADSGGLVTQFGFGPAAASAAPEPASLTLLGIGALGLLGYGWRRRKQAA